MVDVSEPFLKITPAAIVNAKANLFSVNQPRFMVNYTGANISTAITVLWNNEFYDTGNCYNPATGRFTAPIAGNYYIWYTYISAAAMHLTTMHKNGVAIRQSHCNHATNYVMGGNSALLPLVAGDYIHVQTYAGGPYVFYGAGGYANFGGWLVS